MYAVLDFETTGFFGSHRVIEIGIVHLSEDRQVEATWETLVQPNRDISAEITGITGLRASDLRDAPTFEQIAPLFWRQIEGRILVSHSLSFERKMLELELSRLEVEFDLGAGVCTRKLAQNVVRTTDRLCDVAGSLNIELPEFHRALNDAHVAALIFQRLGGSGGSNLMPCASPQLASVGTNLTCCVRDATSTAVQGLDLERLALSQPVGGVDTENADRNAYLTVIDKIVEDHVVTTEEMMLLEKTARMLGMTDADVQSAHRDYLRRFAFAILMDKVITDGERRDFLSLVNLLGCDDVADIVSEPGGIGTMPIVDLAGKTVCFAGSSHCSIGGEHVDRDRAIALASAKGLEVLKGISKKVNILVLGDPLSMSGKARKARDYGIRLVSERMFWMKLGYSVD